MTALSDVTLDVTVPSFARVDAATPSEGQAALVQTVARWYLPSLSAGGQARLTLRLVIMPASARTLDVCVMLLSAGAPLEHCSLFGLGEGEEVPPEEAGLTLARESASESVPTAPPSGVLPQDVPPSVVWGWLFVLLGLAGLGAWSGLQLRGRRLTAGPEEPEEAAPT